MRRRISNINFSVIEAEAIRESKLLQFVIASLIGINVLTFLIGLGIAGFVYFILSLSLIYIHRFMVIYQLL